MIDQHKQRLLLYNVCYIYWPTPDAFRLTSTATKNYSTLNLLVARTQERTAATILKFDPRSKLPLPAGTVRQQPRGAVQGKLTSATPACLLTTKIAAAKRFGGLGRWP